MINKKMAIRLITTCPCLRTMTHNWSPSTTLLSVFAILLSPCNSLICNSLICSYNPPASLHSSCLFLQLSLLSLQHSCLPTTLLSVPMTLPPIPTTLLPIPATFLSVLAILLSVSVTLLPCLRPSYLVRDLQLVSICNSPACPYPLSCLSCLSNSINCLTYLPTTCLHCLAYM